MTGEWPSKEIDHCDGNKSNNKWSNLRLATKSQNQANSRIHKNNKSGVRGVHWHSQSKTWRAMIKTNMKYTYLGSFKSKKDAASAYYAEAKKRFGNFIRI
jgi:hypothetical protein